MDEKQIAFIICTNNPQYYNECVQYIHELTVPDGYSTDIICIQEAPSMAAGYNAGMQASMAKYKVYLHQDTFIMNVNFIGDLLQVFQSDSKVGMIGVIGTTQLSKNSQIFLNWNVGNVEAYDGKQYILSNLIQNPAEGFTEVEAVDGLLIATQYDVLWREDILDGWDFYDISAALEMRRLGYKVVVPYQSKPWCYHDCGVSKMKEYDKYRKKVACEYSEIGFQEETDAQEEKRRLEDIQKLEDIFQVLSGLLKMGLLTQVEIYAQKLREIWPLDTRIREMINMMEIYSMEKKEGILISEWLTKSDWNTMYEYYTWIRFVCLRVALSREDERIEELWDRIKRGKISKIAIKKISEKSCHNSAAIEKRFHI